MAGDVTTMITELLDNSDVIRNMKAEQEALAKVDAKAKALGVTRGQLLKAMKAEDAERVRAIKDQLKQAAAEEKYLADVKQRSFAMERAAEKSERYYSTQNALIGSTGQLSQGMGSLSQQLADVAVGLQGGQKPMTVLIQQGPQIADLFRTNSALAGAFSGALNVLGASAAGAVVLGTPLIAWSKALDEQNEKTRATTAALSAAIDQMGEGASAIGGLQKELERSALRLSGQEGVVEGMEAAEKAGGAYADMLQGLNRDLQIHQDALRDVENGAEGFFEAAFGPSGIERVKQADALKSTIADLTAKIKAMEKEQAIAADTAELVALGERSLVQSNKEVAKSADDGTSSLRTYIAALEDLEKVSAGDRNKPGADDDPVITTMRRQLAFAKASAQEVTGLTVREVEARNKAVVDAEFALQDRLLAIETEAADERARSESRAAMRAVNDKLNAADEAARKLKITDEELQAILTENARLAAGERAQIDAQLTETIENNYKSQLSKRWEIEQQYINDRRNAEIKAAEQSAAAWRSFTSGTQTMLGNLADFAGTMADKMAEKNEEASLRSFRIQQAAEVVEATIAAVRIGQEFAKFAAKINPVLAFPAGAAAFAAAEAAYVAPIAQQEPPSFNDTPSVQKMGGSRGLVNLADNDYFAAAKSPADLQKQVNAFAGGSSGGPTRIETRLVVSGRTAQRIEQAAKVSKRGYTIGQPIAGRRRTRY